MRIARATRAARHSAARRLLYCLVLLGIADTREVWYIQVSPLIDMLNRLEQIQDIR
jgi:hypothetical protein